MRDAERAPRFVVDGRSARQIELRRDVRLRDRAHGDGREDVSLEVRARDDPPRAHDDEHRPRVRPRAPTHVRRPGLERDWRRLRLRTRGSRRALRDVRRLHRRPWQRHVHCVDRGRAAREQGDPRSDATPEGGAADESRERSYFFPAHFCMAHIRSPAGHGHAEGFGVVVVGFGVGAVVGVVPGAVGFGPGPIGTPGLVGVVGAPEGAPDAGGVASVVAAVGVVVGVVGCGVGLSWLSVGGVVGVVFAATVAVAAGFPPDFTAKNTAVEMPATARIPRIRTTVMLLFAFGGSAAIDTGAATGGGARTGAPSGNRPTVSIIGEVALATGAAGAAASAFRSMRPESSLVAVVELVFAGAAVVDVSALREKRTEFSSRLPALAELESEELSPPPSPIPPEKRSPLRRPESRRAAARGSAAAGAAARGSGAGAL